MTNVYSVVNGIFSATIRRLYPDFNKLKNTLQPEAKFGDYKSTVALQIAQVKTNNYTFINKNQFFVIRC